jgi:hypothetical protein
MEIPNNPLQADDPPPKPDDDVDTKVGRTDDNLELPSDR